MAAWVEERVRRRFDRVVVERTPDDVPVVLGELTGTGPGRVVVYTHYDVQPAGDLAAWDSDPFGAELRDGAVWARGTCDDKADVTARLQAIDYWLDANGGAAPVTLLWVCEGAEEIGSPGLAEVLARHAGWLSASDCLWESFVRRDDGRPEVAFGCRGLVSAELRVRQPRGRRRGDRDRGVPRRRRRACAGRARGRAGPRTARRDARPGRTVRL